ncbi:MAG: VOC family protein [Hyphomonas sp.]|jgi:catechol 2,3-dioxygenase-like lactoylglutathione lyase family enzyme|uniref:VOC family protein n=1 Tax=Hyphomonas sp. TaxID=87 RepID=UPI0034A0640A
MKRLLIPALCAAFLAACTHVDTSSPAPGQPELLGASNPYPAFDINLRRTTLVVRDVEASLKLYRDALGFDVVYDEELTSPGLTTRHEADGRNRSRLVLTQTNSGELGMIGLWQFLDQTDKDLAAPDPADFTPGEIVLLFHTENLETRFAAASRVPGVTVLGAPSERRYPSPAGDIVVMVSMLVDPDGHTIELNQKIFDPRDKP